MAPVSEMDAVDKVKTARHPFKGKTREALTLCTTVVHAYVFCEAISTALSQK